MKRHDSYRGRQKYRLPAIVPELIIDDCIKVLLR